MRDNVFVHTADIHLAPRTGASVKIDPATGRSIRDTDREAAFERAVDETLSQDELPVAFLISGDIFDSYRGSIDALIFARKQLSRLISSGISVVAIAGNHDTPTNALKTSMYEALHDTVEAGGGEDGAVVCMAYDSIEHVRCGEIEFVLLPHKVCVEGGFTESDLARCTDAKYAVLAVHGVAAGDPSLKQMDEAKEIPIAKWILDMDWDYIAFGHFHKPGWIPGYEGKAAYCGSLENTVSSGPDVCMERGPVFVDLEKDADERFDMHPQDIRQIVDLEDISISPDMSPQQIDEAISARIRGNEDRESIVHLNVKGITRSQYKSLPRRNFTSDDPSALMVKVNFTFAEQKALAVDGDEQEGQENDSPSDTMHDDVLLPLAKEIENAVETLVADGTLPDSEKDTIESILKGMVAE